MATNPAVGTVRFGVFELDLRTGELRKAGQRVRLQGQPCQILTALLECPGEVVTREKLRQLIWPSGTFVDFEVGLNAAIKRLRYALGDSADNPLYVETVPRVGYRLIVPVQPADPPEPPAVSPSIPLVEQKRPSLAPRLSGWQWIFAALSAVVLIGLGVWLARRPPRTIAIAVLPLRNLSSQPNSDYFGDGLTDEIIRNLSVIEGLEVKSRGSSFEYKNKPINLREAGKQLGADLIIEGSVFHEGDRLRINVDLVEAATDRAVWSAQYDRELKDVFAIQDEISLSIVNQLRLKKIGRERRYNTNLAAYDLYLQAESQAKEGSIGPGILAGAIELYNKAIEKDANFASAYAGLAHCYARLRTRGNYEEPDRQMRLAAQRAIELDPLLPEAYAMQGLVYASDLDWGNAEKSFRRALELNPNLAYVREDFSMYVLLPVGKLAEAEQQSRKAVKLDPLTRARKVMLAFILMSSGSYSEARDLSHSVFLSTQKDSSRGLAGQIYCRALMLQGQNDEAIRILQSLGPGNYGALGYAYAKAGRRQEAEALAESPDPATPRHRVLIYAGLGDRDRVFKALQDDAALHDGLVDVYPSYPELAWLRDDPRMKAFRQTRNLH